MLHSPPHDFCRMLPGLFFLLIIETLNETLHTTPQSLPQITCIYSSLQSIQQLNTKTSIYIYTIHDNSHAKTTQTGMRSLRLYLIRQTPLVVKNKLYCYNIYLKFNVSIIHKSIYVLVYKQFLICSWVVIFVNICSILSHSFSASRTLHFFSLSLFPVLVHYSQKIHICESIHY